MKPPKRLFKRREPDHRWFEALAEAAIDAGMVAEGHYFGRPWTEEKLRHFFACVARPIAQLVVEKAHHEPGTYEYRTKDDGEAGFVLATVEIEAGGRVFLTYPNNLTIGFNPEDLFDPEDN
jgi:hypothetical protein